MNQTAPGQVQEVVIVGAGFTGLTAAYVLSKHGVKVCVIEADRKPGGLAGVFEFDDGVEVEKFYHHWFNNDVYVPELVEELGLSGEVITLPSKTGMFLNGRMWKLSTPLDLLRFSALGFWDRIRLGLLVLQVRRIKDWKRIEHLSIREWLESMCGKRVYDVVWAPLVDSKFSVYAETVNAVWMWKKLVLRGSTRSSGGREELAYFRGGFGRLAEALVAAIESHGGKVIFGQAVDHAEISSDGDQVDALLLANGEKLTADRYLFTPSLSITAEIFRESSQRDWLDQLQRVKYLGNICLVLRLDKKLSDTYWINVNDPGFPFVGVIEHTNFDTPDNYRGSHIAYLSRYLATSDPVWDYTDAEYFDYALAHIVKMFPDFEASSVIDYKVWRADYAQPVTELNYSSYVPGRETPFKNALISTMAQIYPEDRGTNYAIREGRSVADSLFKLSGEKAE